MAKEYQYNWHHIGSQKPNDQSVSFDKALETDVIFADLRDGRTYKILTIKPGPKECGSFRHVPKEVIHTTDGAPLDGAQLAQLRKRCAFEGGDDPWPYLILEAAEGSQGPPVERNRIAPERYGRIARNER